MQFVVGLPVHTHGGESQKSIEAQTFGKWLTEKPASRSTTSMSGSPRPLRNNYSKMRG